MSFFSSNSLPPLPEILHANAPENNLENRVYSFDFGIFLSWALLASTVCIIIIVVRCCQHPCLVSQIALTAFQASLRIAQDSDVWWWVESCHYNGSSLPMDLYRESQTLYWRISLESLGWKRWARSSWGVYTVLLISSDSEQHWTQISSKASYQCTVCSFWAGRLFLIVNLYCSTTQKSKQRALARVMTL